MGAMQGGNDNVQSRAGGHGFAFCRYTGSEQPLHPMRFVPSEKELRLELREPLCRQSQRRLYHGPKLLGSQERMITRVAYGDELCVIQTSVPKGSQAAVVAQ